MIENLKDGMVVNVKWKVADVDWESPQIVIFANDDPAEFVGTKMSADKLVDVELRAFNASIEAGVVAPPQTLADLRARPVVRSHDRRPRPHLRRCRAGAASGPTSAAVADPPFRQDVKLNAAVDLTATTTTTTAKSTTTHLATHQSLLVKSCNGDGLCTFRTSLDSSLSQRTTAARWTVVSVLLSTSSLTSPWQSWWLQQS